MRKAMMLAVFASMIPAPVLAKAPINQWLCKVLKVPFDPAAAIAAFPLEALPPPIETRDAVSDNTTSVELKAEGEQWTVEYGFQYANDDVSDPYGFDIKVSSAYGGADDFKKQTEKLLREFGKPQRDTLGEKVFAGKPAYEGGDPPFSFGRWTVIGMYTASWWKRSDVRLAAELCK